MLQLREKYTKLGEHYIKYKNLTTNSMITFNRTIITINSNETNKYVTLTIKLMCLVNFHSLQLLRVNIYLFLQLQFRTRIRNKLRNLDALTFVFHN